MNFINLNGKILPSGEGAIPVDNGAFRYGYGLFETMLVQHGDIRLKDYHWERLFSGIRQLQFQLPVFFTPQWLEQQTLKLVKKNGADTLCRVRLQLFAAGGGLYSSESKQPLFVIECFPIEPTSITLNVNGLVIGIAAGLKKSTDSLGNLKSCNALIYAMAARQAKDHKWNDALIANSTGNICESTLANIFWVKDNQLFTPPLSEGCVAGVMRRHIIERFHPVTEKQLPLEELLAADEVFLTNAIKGIKWVTALGDRSYTSKWINTHYNNCMPTTTNP